MSRDRGVYVERLKLSLVLFFSVGDERVLCGQGVASGRSKSSAKSSAAAGSDIGSAGSVTKGASDARGPLPLT